jgi:hypothetical protein
MSAHRSRDFSGENDGEGKPGRIGGQVEGIAARAAARVARPG